MSCVPPSCGAGGTPPATRGTGSTNTADSAIAKMEATFNIAIEKSAKITEICSAKKAELDATKQRPQN